MHYYFGIAAVLFVLSQAEKAGITSAWLERRQERGNVSERQRESGQVRPESCLCVAAGSCEHCPSL